MAALPLHAAEITVMSGGALKAPLEAIAARYTRETGDTVRIDFATAGELRKKLAAGERADLLVLPAENLDAVEREGRIVPGARTPLGRVGIGVAVNEKAPAPDISTPDAFRATLLAARSIVYVDPERGTSGKHFAQVLVDLGIAEQMKPKSLIKPVGIDVATAVANGEAEIGVTFRSELMPNKGVTVSPTFPEAIQSPTLYVVGVSSTAKAMDAARAFAAYALTPESQAKLSPIGVQPAARPR
jgi:molybdate transport system substrate-binding protein